MNNKNMNPKNVVIKSEQTSPTAKKIIISSSLIPPSAIKKEPSARLPSFKPPRDLLLTGCTTSHSTPNLKDFINSSHKVNKRKYTPNVNIFRKKASNSVASNDSLPEVEMKTRNIEHAKRSPAMNRKRNTNFIQTKGVFSEGLAPGKVKAFSSSYSERSHNESSVMEKPKLVLNQKINKTNEDLKLQSILKDDFIDDPNSIPDLTFVPRSLPTIYNGMALERKLKCDPHDIERTFQNLQVKIDKVGFKKAYDIKDEKSELFDTFNESDSPKLLMFEFPKAVYTIDVNEKDKKKTSKAQSVNETENKAKLNNLASAGEGHWGYLRIHESGNAYFVVGNNVIPISISRHIARQEVMSTSIDQSRGKGEIINLGTIDASFTCSTNFDDVH